MTTTPHPKAVAIQAWLNANGYSCDETGVFDDGTRTCMRTALMDRAAWDSDEQRHAVVIQKMESIMPSEA